MGDYVSEYGALFRCHRRDNEEKAYQYLCGLFHEGKHNIERMNERIVDSTYSALQHFISDSPWDHKSVLSAVRQDISKLFTVFPDPVGLILDESGHRKGGRDSVGVARQYLGSIGKVDNGQVGVFAALSQRDDVGMVASRLYLPKQWSDNQSRCRKAGIPEEEQRYRTKPELALEMVKEMEGEITYDWIGGDSIYGNSPTLRQGLTELNRCFVMDISERLAVYLSDPMPYIPQSDLGRGRKKSSLVSDRKPIKVRELANSLKQEDWTLYTVRQGTKGPIRRASYCIEVYLWSAQRPTTFEVEKMRLIISRNPDGTELKYSLTNEIALDKQAKLSDQALLYRQMNRYWVERGFQDLKDVLGMTDYQVRGWRAWHHHITLTIMALHYILEQKIKVHNEIPLLSCSDIKLFLALTLERKAADPEKVWNLIQVRHQQRKADLDRYKLK